VLLGPGLIPETGAFVRRFFTPRPCALLVDENIRSLFAETVCESLRAENFAPHLLTIAGGEQAKSMSQAAILCEQMSRAGLDRSSFVVSLGGGVVGDLGGFVAAIFLRGIPYVSIPTTLLAQVDSCIGGKTAVNSSAGKNLIGAIHHPTLVIADTETLRTLPERIWNEGFAEAIKHGIVRDRELFEMVPAVERHNPVEFIARNLAIKAAIVSADERERNGERALLNFGHTIGHAIEFAAGYGKMLHGEAISLGIIAAADISTRRAGLSLGEAARIRETLAARHLPTKLPADAPREAILEALERDKKFEQRRIRFVVAHTIGRASVSDEVTMDDLAAAVAAL
jgi:3-dehydroquinate synthase